MVAENGECKVYEKRDKGEYIKLLTKYIKNLSNTKQENMTTKVDDIMKEKFLCQSRFAEEVEK